MKDLDFPVIAIDLDNTLCKPVSSSKNVGDSYNREPKEYMIKLVRELKKKGCKIVIIAHRHLVTRHATEFWLEDHKIPYDELVIGIPNYTLLLSSNGFPSYRYLTADMVLDLADKVSKWNYELGSYENRTNNEKSQSK